MVMPLVVPTCPQIVTSSSIITQPAMPVCEVIQQFFPNYGIVTNMHLIVQFGAFTNGCVTGNSFVDGAKCPNANIVLDNHSAARK